MVFGFFYPIARPGVTNLFDTESYFLVQIHAKGYQFDTHFWNKNLLNLSSIMLSLIEMKIFINVKTMIMFCYCQNKRASDPRGPCRATWLVTPELDTKLNNTKCTCLIALKFSSKIDFYQKIICVNFGWKRPSMRKLFGPAEQLAAINFLGRLSTLLVTCTNSSPMCWA